jgi:hypothetical protein
MRYEFDFDIAQWEYRIDPDALIIVSSSRAGNYETRIPWSQIIRAGISPKYQLTDDVAGVVHMVNNTFFPPGLKQLTRKGLDLQNKTDMLLIAYQPKKRKKKKVFGGQIARDDIREALIDELKKRLPDRWDDTPLDADAFYREMRAYPWWTIPAAILFMGGFCGLVAAWTLFQVEYGILITLGALIFLFIAWMRQQSDY